MILQTFTSTHTGLALIQSRRTGTFSTVAAKADPGIPKLLQQIDDLKEAAKALPEFDPGAGTKKVEEALEKGTIGRLDLVATLGPAVCAAAAYRETAQQLEAILDRLYAGVSAAVQAAAPTMLANMEADVRATVDKLRDNAAAKAGITTADEAVDAALLDAWAEYRKLAARWAEAYEIVAAMATAGLFGFVDPNFFQLDLAISRLGNAETAAPDFLPHRAGAAHLPDRRRKPPVGGPVTADAFLAWLIRTPDAIPAILSPDQHVDRMQAVRGATTAWKAAQREARKPEAQPEVKFPNPFISHGMNAPLEKSKR